MMHFDALDKSAEEAAVFLRTMAHAGRLRIVCALMGKELSATELARQARLPAPALSQQAAILEAKGLIGRRRDGRSIVYRLLAPEAKALAKLLYRMFCRMPAARARRRALKRRKTHD
jgi:DNA-binding transcriptional ArsR family regulator